MDRDKTYERLGNKWIKLTSQEAKVKETKEKLRAELSGVIKEEFAEKDYLLPIITETIPNSFFEATGISYDEFLGTRYPGWELISEIDMENEVVFILKKRPEFMGKVIELGKDVQLTKTVVEYSPEIDWKTLEKEFPELADRISKIVETKVVDEEALELETEENPEIFSILRRHMRVKPPTNKYLTPRRKDEK